MLEINCDIKSASDIVLKRYSRFSILTGVFNWLYYFKSKNRNTNLIRVFRVASAESWTGVFLTVYCLTMNKSCNTILNCLFHKLVSGKAI